MPFFLKILASPQNARDGEKMELANGDNLLGRTKPPAHLVLDGSKVSRKHCLFHVKGQNLEVSDLGSANGVYVNGKKLDSMALKVKDRLVIGEFVLEVTVK